MGLWLQTFLVFIYSLICQKSYLLNCTCPLIVWIFVCICLFLLMKSYCSWGLNALVPLKFPWDSWAQCPSSWTSKCHLMGCLLAFYWSFFTFSFDLYDWVFFCILVLVYTLLKRPNPKNQTKMVSSVFTRSKNKAYGLLLQFNLSIIVVFPLLCRGFFIALLISWIFFSLDS